MHSSLVGLKEDGTVVDDDYRNQAMVSDWKNITALRVSMQWTTGLKTDGTIIQTDPNAGTSSILKGCQDIAEISPRNNLAAIKTDGSVFIANNDVQRKVSDWKDIVAVENKWGYAVGLKADGTVVTTGENTCGQSNVSRWRDIVSIATTGAHTVGLKADGTVVAAGYNEDGQCNTQDWTNVVAIAVSDWETVALKADGTVVRTGPWGLVDSWKLFDNLESLAQIRTEAAARRAAEIEAEQRRREEEAEQQRLEEERRLEAERQEAERLRIEAERQEKERRRVEAERQKKISKLKSERSDLQVELANLKGLFSGGRRRELEAKLVQIEKELNNL